MGGEVEFPEAIIQSIQSLLTGEEAARTTILSKSWHRAWLTRPNLDLDDTRFEYGFCEYAKQTIKRYQQSNLKIERFKLHMKNNCCCGDKADKLIVKALTKLGATRLFLRLNGRIEIPCEAVFGADKLVELSVKGCQINLDEIAIKCCRLESLCLDGVGIDRDVVYNIVSSCPLIEKLSLFSFYSSGEQRGLNLEWLRCLVLCNRSFEAFFPGEFLSKLPLLKDFTLVNLRPSCLVRTEGGLDVQISNCSLEHVKIVIEKEKYRRRRQSDDVRLKVKLDVPNIRKFTFEGGDFIPELCFASSSSTATREWESHVSFANYDFFSLFCFHKLNEFLTQLRQSKIHLSLVVESMGACRDYRFGDLSVSRRHELESLTMDLTGLPPFNCSALLDGLFRLCRPKLITQQIQKTEDRVSEWKENTDLLWHAFEQGMHVSIPRQIMYGLKDLEDVNAQIFEDDVWRPLLPEEQDQEQQTIRFLLKWTPS